MLFIFTGWPLLYHTFFALLTCGLALWFYGIFHPQSQLLGPVLYQMNTKEKEVALTFDDGPHEVFTPMILDILKKYGVKATFFVMGERAAQYPGLLRRLVEEGHEIGNHTYSHNYLLSAPVYPKSIYREEILAVDKLLTSHQIPCGPWVRLPMGFKNGRLLKVAQQLGKRVVAFSFRSYDSIGSPEALVRRILHKVYPGAILALHDGPDKWRHNQYSRTVKALPGILEGLQAKGYHIVTLGELDGDSSAGKF